MTGRRRGRAGEVMMKRVAPSEVALGELIAVFARIGLMSFGGPAAQIALMHRALVEERGWLDERTFLNALNFCMLLPGPEAMQLATYGGWRLRGVVGGLIAGGLFVAPGALIMLALAAIYAHFGEVPLVSALFLGVKAAVLAIVFEALLRVARRALSGPAHWGIAGAAFVGLFVLQLPYPLIIAAAALYGFLFDARGRETDGRASAPVSLAATARVMALGAALWLGPIALAGWAFDGALLGTVGVFFSKLAVVTFGGAYAVLAYMAQEVVAVHGWLGPGEMMDGLGLAETTPGPLILVTEFVGFLAGFHEGGLGLGIAAALMTLWATFAPCFLWIFAGAPYVERISAEPRLAGALSAITAAVVGVILNLSLWFALHVLFGEVGFRAFGPIGVWAPELASFDWRAAALAALSAVLLLRLHLGVGWTLAIAAAFACALASIV